jgi:MFS family permease
MGSPSLNDTEAYGIERVDPKQRSGTPAATEDNHLGNVVTQDSLQRRNFFSDAENLDPRNYWRSPRFAGSLLAAFLLANSLFIAFGLPINLLTIINADIGPSPDIYLVTLIFNIFLGTLHLLVGRLSDILGRRYFLLGGTLISVAGSTVCALANNVTTVIGGSVLTGTGAASSLLYPVIIHEVLPNKYRHWGHAAVTLSVLPTLGFGSSIARTFVANTSLSWRGAYWLNVAVSGAAFILFAMCYFPPDFRMINSKLTKWQEVKQFDYLGFVLYFAGLLLLILGFSWPPGVFPWKSAQVISTLIIGTGCLVVFTLYEVYMPLKQPLFPFRLIKIRNIWTCVVIGSTMQMVWFALNVFWPVQLTVLYTNNETKIGLLSSINGIALIVGELCAAVLFKSVGRLRIQMVVACIITAVVTSLMAIVTYKTLGLGIAINCVTGWSVGWIELVTIVVVGLVAPPHDIGVAQTFFASTRQLFGTIASESFLK